MRKKHKTAFKVLALVLGLFAVTGCTANFCSVNDKAHILYNYDAGLSYDEAGQPIIKDDVLQFKNEAVTKQMASIAKNYDVPSKTFFVALDEKVKELAMDAYTKDANKVAGLTAEEILKQYGYLKFAGQKENKKGKMVDTLWANWDNMVEQIKKEIPMSDHPSKDFIAQYKKALNSVISANRTCITPVSGEYGSEGNKVYIEGKTWGQAFKKGFLEGLLVYPVAWVSHQLTQGFLNANVHAGWAQLLAILFTTIIVRGLLMLLTFKTTMNQQKMTALQPELAKIQAKYPNSNTNQYEKQRMAEEQMKLYKKYKIKPLNQILAMILQFFIFVAVWGALSGSSILTSGDIYGMHLSASIGSFITKFDFSSAWWTSLILFILMSGTQIVSTKLPQWMQKKNTKNVEKLGKNPAQDAQTKQMKYMTNFMMIMIIVMGFSLPSGMGLYWLFGAIISMIQTVITQSILKRKKMK